MNSSKKLREKRIVGIYLNQFNDIEHNLNAAKLKAPDEIAFIGDIDTINKERTNTIRNFQKESDSIGFTCSFYTQSEMEQMLSDDSIELTVLREIIRDENNYEKEVITKFVTLLSTSKDEKNHDVMATLVSCIVDKLIETENSHRKSISLESLINVCNMKSIKEMFQYINYCQTNENIIDAFQRLASENYKIIFTKEH
jgi:hypothetical protein